MTVSPKTALMLIELAGGVMDTRSSKRQTAFVRVCPDANCVGWVDLSRSSTSPMPPLLIGTFMPVTDEAVIDRDTDPRIQEFRCSD
jgi:hypothetical protein